MRKNTIQPKRLILLTPLKLYTQLKESYNSMQKTLTVFNFE
jgi:hypothetical protein